MINHNMTGVDVGLPTPEEFTKELLSEKIDPDLADACITKYGIHYRNCARLVMDGKLDEAQKLRDSLTA